jgi:hypothetical protein
MRLTPAAPAVDAGPPFAIRMTKIKGGGTSYLDFDHVRLTATPAKDFRAWIGNPAFGIDEQDQGFEADPDSDNLANGVEALFGTHPGQACARRWCCRRDWFPGEVRRFPCPIRCPHILTGSPRRLPG